MMSKSIPPSLSFLTCLLLFGLSITPKRTLASTVPCTRTEECERIILKGSECIDGRCSNPYFKGGCLARRLEGWNRIRVCNSEDPPEAIKNGFCKLPNPDFDYMELRMAGQNWESAFFQVWIIQILLSEILGVPVSLETGQADAKLGFYDARSRMDYGVGYDWEALRRGHEVGDCRFLHESQQQQQNDTQNDTAATKYQSCAHFIPEVWYGAQEQMLQLETEEIAERSHPMGTLGHQGLFVPRFTALHDPSLLTSLGLSGASGNRTEARHKLAETFLRPTRWGDYCQLVSANNCTIPDGIANRAPRDTAEARQFFNAQHYQGHFRKTEQNDCVTHPDTCTGHFVDYPCGWSGYARQQIYHLGIALESNGDNPGSNGYEYTEMVDIWSAANATNSHVIMQWWWPEALYQTFLGTSFEFQRVSLPPATLDCVAERVDFVTRCYGETFAERVGSAIGSCDEPPFSLQRSVTSSLRNLIYDPSIPEELRNPGYDAVKGIRLDGLQMGKIFDYWLKRGSDKWNFDPRDAACRWLTENFDYVQTWVPGTYPRVTVENEQVWGEQAFVVSVVFLAMALFCNIVSIVGVLCYRKKKCMVYAQVEFLLLLLFGMLLVNIGSVLLIAPASDAVCLLFAWTSTLGYTFELIPLIVKVYAINNLVTAAGSMRRLVLKRQTLYGQVLAVAVVVVVFLAIWSVMDPPHKASQYDLTTEETDYGETIVKVSYFCASDNDAWPLVGTAAWHALMLVVATAMAFQTRKVKGCLNESMILAILIYSHFVFVVFRLLLFFSEDKFEIWNVPRYLSIIYSIDGIATCCVYYFPKILFDDEGGATGRHRSSRGISGLVRRFSRPMGSGATNQQHHRRNPSTPSQAEHLDSYNLSSFESTRVITSLVDQDSSVVEDLRDRLERQHGSSSNNIGQKGFLESSAQD